jgi:hypothetical protein
MRRCAISVAVVTALLSGVLLARAAWPGATVPSTSPSPAGPLPPADALTGPAGWQYRHSQPTHWRSCLLQQ